MSKTLSPASPQTGKDADARALQARLYREIGISAVSAALHFTRQPDPGKPVATQHPLPPGLRNNDVAA